MSERAIICVVEDNDSDVYLLRIVLQQHQVDCGLLVFSDGEKALEFVENTERSQAEPVLFIVDLNLPKVDGREILSHLRSNLRFRDVPVIVWTSSDSPRDRQKSLSLKASHHICKPTTVNAFMDLGGVIKSLLPVEH